MRGTRRAGLLSTLATTFIALPQTSVAQEPPGEPDPVPAALQDSATQPDPLADAAERLEQGMPVTASRLLSLHLAETNIARPDVILANAAAYAAYGAWPSVRRLLAGQPWLDSLGSGQGRRLLARAYLETGSVSAATAEYVRYLDRVGPPESDMADESVAEGQPGDRVPTTEPDADAILQARVSYARGLSSQGRHSEAAEQLELAAGSRPDIGRWLELSALYQRSAAEDSAGSAALAARLLDDRVIPSDSVHRQLALLAFRRGAAEEGERLASQAGHSVFLSLAGEYVAPARLAAGDTAGALVAYRAAIQARRSVPDVGPALISLDSGWNTLVAVAESDLRSGRRSRGKLYLTRALEVAPDEERVGIAQSLAAAHRAAGDYAQAVTTLGPWLRGDDLPARRKASVWFLAGRSLLAMGQERAATEAFQFAASAGSYTESAFASYLVADLLHDAGQLDTARVIYGITADRFPTSNFGGLALTRLGQLAFLEGRFEEAIKHYATYRGRFPSGRWLQGSVYWTARALEASGDTAAANARYRETIRYNPLSYYGILAATRTVTDPWASLNLSPQPMPLIRESDGELVARMNTLRLLGWSSRARHELQLAGDGRTPDQSLALAISLNEAGWTKEGIARAWQVRRSKRGWSEALLKAIYPLPYRTALEQAAALRGLEPSFVAGLTRRESLFDREVISVANAVGLMQLLPRTAADVAQRAGLSEFNASQLTTAQVNLLLGTQYLSDMLGRFGGSREAGLISYNAGPHRYLQWRDFVEREADPELFVERIPFRETRDYVKAVIALEYIYARLYGLCSGSQPASGSPAAWPPKRC